jgi:hypothetical protein
VSLLYNIYPQQANALISFPNHPRETWVAGKHQNRQRRATHLLGSILNTRSAIAPYTSPTKLFYDCDDISSIQSDLAQPARQTPTDSMPLMISPDGKGWVKVPPKNRRTAPVSRADQAAVLKSPLAYFACQPVAPSKPKISTCPVYTLDPNEHTPPTSEEGSPRKSSKKSQRGRSQARSASTPHHRHPYDDDYPPSDYEAEEEVAYHSSGAVRPPGARSTISYDRVRPRAHAGPTAPRPTSAPKPRAVTTAPTPAPATATGYTYWTGPSNKPRVPPRSAAWGGGSSASSSSGASARWANATAPLAL